MGFAVVGMGFINFGPSVMKESLACDIAHAMFWIDVVLCVISMTVPMYMMVVHQTHKFETMASLWLLPFVSCVVAAAMAGVITQPNVLLSDALKTNVVFAGFVLWGAGILTAAPIIAVYMCRLVFYGMPPNAAGNSVFVVLGPIGQGANGIMQLGRATGTLLYDFENELQEKTASHLNKANASPISAISPLQSLGIVAPGVTLLIGLVMWGLGLFWLYFAATTSCSHISVIQKLLRWNGSKNMNEKGETISFMPFNLGWWGVVFPFITLIMATYQLYIDTHFAFFMWMGRIFAVVLVSISFYVHAKTLYKVTQPTFWNKFKPQ